jgi:hypothetical protein
LSFVEKNSLQNKFNAFTITNMWQVYTRPNSASDFFWSKPRSKHIFLKNLYGKIGIEIESASSVGFR